MRKFILTVALASVLLVQAAATVLAGSTGPGV